MLVHLTTRSKLLALSLGVAIVVILNLLLNVGLQLVLHEPEYRDFCPEEQVQIPITLKEQCLTVGGQWVEQGSIPEKRPAPRPASFEAETFPSYCNPDFTCAKTFETARHLYNRNVFLILVLAGLISLLIGFRVATSSAVSLGFSWGGVLAFVIGSVRYWADMEEYLRFILLLIVLIVLVWLGLKKLKDAGSESEPQ